MKDFTVQQTSVTLTLQEVCERCYVEEEKIITLVEHGVVEPEGETYTQWRFTSTAYLRLKKALRLEKDLSINEPGLALAIELLDQLNEAQKEIAYLRKRVQPSKISK